MLKEFFTKKTPNYAFLYILFSITFVIILIQRHYFDDEIASLIFLYNSKAENIFSLINYTNSIDVSPPIQYIIPYLFAKINLEKYSAIISLPIYFYVFYLLNKKVLLSKDNDVKNIFYLFIIFNHSILIWCTSIRWYSYWFPLFLVFLITYFFSNFKKTDKIIILTTSIIMFYTSYLTALIIFLLFITEMILFLLKNKNKAKNFLIFCESNYFYFLVFAIFIIPQIINFSVNQVNHVSTSQFFSMEISLINTLITSLISNAVFPLEFSSIFYVISIFIIFFSNIKESKKILLSNLKLVLFLCLGIVLMAVTTQGYKLRNSMFLNFSFFLLITLLYQKCSFRIKNIFIFFFLIFLTHGIYNVIYSSNTQKNSINVPINKIINYFKNNKELCDMKFIYTSDIVIDFYLKKSFKNNDKIIVNNFNSTNQNCFFYIKSFSDRGMKKNKVNELVSKIENNKNFKKKYFRIDYDKFNNLKKKVFNIKNKSFIIEIIYYKKI